MKEDGEEENGEEKDGRDALPEEEAATLGSTLQWDLQPSIRPD